MTPTNLREALAALHWSQRALAVILDCNPTTVQRWARGQDDVPDVIADRLGKLAAPAAGNQPPTDWRRPRGPRAAA